MALSFDDLVLIKSGDVLWEGSSYGCRQFTVTESATVELDDHNRRQVRWKGVTSPTALTVSFLVTEHLEHYGPRIYRDCPYFNPKDLP